MFAITKPIHALGGGLGWALTINKRKDEIKGRHGIAPCRVTIILSRILLFVQRVTSSRVSDFLHIL